LNNKKTHTTLTVLSPWSNVTSSDSFWRQGLLKTELFASY